MPAILARLLSLLPQGKMSGDIAWTMCSFVVLAASGILINLVIVWFQGARELGIFNQAYAIYIVVSQIASFGIQYSVMRHVAYHAKEPAVLGEILGSAILPTLLLGVGSAGTLWMVEPMIANLLSPDAARATTFAAIGLALFPLSKVLISFFNGLREMKAFALLQIVRYLIIAVFVAVVAAGDIPFVYATLCFLAAELMTLLVALVFLVRGKFLADMKITAYWVDKHLRFGGKSLMAGMLGEVNTRVDVLCIGYFMTDAAVGIYSFAVVLMDGLFHLLAMIRVNFNPVLVVAVRDGAWSDVKNLLKKSRTYTTLAMLILTLVIVSFYMIVTQIVLPERGLQAGLPSLIILLAGLTLVSGFVPFDNLFLSGGFPGYQTLQQFFAVLTNVVFNVGLIPVIGIAGAAVGTALSYCASILFLAVLAQKLFGWNPLTNKVSD